MLLFLIDFRELKKKIINNYLNIIFLIGNLEELKFKFFYRNLIYYIEKYQFFKKNLRICSKQVIGGVSCFLNFFFF